MVRIIIKGGVWKNTEDEVLKAAIAKYGKNQWARISSLLVRKTPKQCKARWYEWLDPSIKKTEWSKVEDEKLLHLAKLMPTQWRTIAPIVGRTATQCLERYQKLLDEAEAKENEELGLIGPEGPEAGPSVEDIRRLRPGEIDPDPETKPARPDPIDMDEDEKEMLSEARARLANTQGKKAKRKARERQLEEARRLAVLQKKRELKAAGIIMRHKTKRKGMDYNADIPFEKKPAAGFYDTSEEQARVASAPVGHTLRRLENKRKPEEEEVERKKRQRKADSAKEGGEFPQHQTKFVAARDAQILKLKEAESIGRRRKLVLPGAQVGEAELEDIVKIGQAGENAKALVGGGTNASGRLFCDYEGLENARMARTPRTTPQQDHVLTEARNVRNMAMMQTPLLGDENTPMHMGHGGADFGGAIPRHQVLITQNPLATPLYTNTTNIHVTPRSDLKFGITATPLRTPVRDNLSINPTSELFANGSTPLEQRRHTTPIQRALKTGFMNLPKPENNFELLVPEEEVDVLGLANDGALLEDAAERENKLLKEKEEARRQAFAHRSQVVQLGLPRPPNIDTTQLLRDLNMSGNERLDQARHLLDMELVQLLQHDAVVHPVPGTSLPGGTKSLYEMPTDNAIAAARSEIHNELAMALDFPTANPEQLQKGVATLFKAELDQPISWAIDQQNLIIRMTSDVLPNPQKPSSDKRSAVHNALLDEHRNLMTSDANKVYKAEKKLAVTLAGYQVRSNALAKRITGAFEELQKSTLDYESFSRLSINESAAGPRRVVHLKEEVEKLEQRERVLQNRYAELEAEREESRQKLAALEERIMAEAEALNDASLEVDGFT